MDNATINERKDRLLRDQMRMIDRQRQEIAQLRSEIAELKELIDLKDRYVNEIYRNHFSMGGAAINIELERITNDGMPLMPCYDEIDNGVYKTIVRVRR